MDSLEIHMSKSRKNAWEESEKKGKKMYQRKGFENGLTMRPCSEKCFF